jgi:hypothetical protein
MVSVRARPDAEVWLCEVDVDDDRSKTHHLVTVTREDLERWGSGAGREAVEDLVTRSFAFLLEREPATSILRTFDLSVIRRYFPEYDKRFSR